jgi:hypothetical protein
MTDFSGIRKRRPSFAGRQLVLAVLHNLVPVKFALLDCERQLDIAGNIRVDEFPCSLPALLYPFLVVFGGLMSLKKVALVLNDGVGKVIDVRSCTS